MSKRIDDCYYITRLYLLYEHYDYYVAMGATVEFEVDGEVFEFDLVETSPKDESRVDATRRRLRQNNGRLYLDRRQRNGEVMEVTPWLDEPGKKVEHITDVRVEMEVTPNGAR